MTNESREVSVALLRAVNVGGTGKLPMVELRRAAERLGWQGVRTIGAAGSLVFRADGTAEDQAGALSSALAVDALVVGGDRFRGLAARCPWPGAEGRTVVAAFLWEPAEIDRAALDRLAAPGEEMQLDGLVAWLHLPHGQGRSRLAAGLSRVLPGARITARNLNTVRRLAEMVDEAADG